MSVRLQRAQTQLPASFETALLPARGERLAS